MVAAWGLGASLCLPAGASATSSSVACTDSASHDNGALNTAIAAATSGDVVTVSGTCLANLTIANTAPFTVKGSGAATWNPAVVSTSMIQSSADVRFTVSGITFTGMNGASAITLTGAGEAATISDDGFMDNTTPTGGAAVSITQGTTPTTTQATVLEGNTFGAVGAGNTAGYGGAVYLQGAVPFTVINNAFVANSSPLGLDRPGGALAIATFAPSSTSPVIVSGNTFGGTAAGAGNTSGTNGGAAFIELAPGQKLTLNDNKFIDNAVTGSGVATGPRVGGALTVTIENGTTGFSVSQAHNTFTGNVVDATEATGFNNLAAGGGGEWLFGVTDRSVGDVFSGNRITVNDGAPPEGGALGVLGVGMQGSTPPQPGAYVGTNDVFLHNSVAANGWGGAIYTGFELPNCTSACPGSSVALFDSTVSGNTVAPGAGSEGGALWGGPLDTLSVNNTIVYDNSPQPETYGFRSPVFAFSDACVIGATPQPGAGNICANPLLQSNGSEPATSPTIDRGSNARVPAGLTTDFAGGSRITEGRASTCHAIVDMGAFESRPVSPSAGCTIGTTRLGASKTTSKGVTVIIHCNGASSAQICAGALSLFAREHRSRGKVVSVSGKRKRGQQIVTVRLARKRFALHAGQTLKLSIPIDRQGLGLLRHFHRLPVELVVAVSAANGRLTLPPRHLTIKRARHK